MIHTLCSHMVEVIINFIVPSFGDSRNISSSTNMNLTTVKKCFLFRFFYCIYWEMFPCNWTQSALRICLHIIFLYHWKHYSILSVKLSLPLTFLESLLADFVDRPNCFVPNLAVSRLYVITSLNIITPNLSCRGALACNIFKQMTIVF